VDTTTTPIPILNSKKFNMIISSDKTESMLTQGNPPDGKLAVSDKLI